MTDIGTTAMARPGARAAEAIRNDDSGGGVATSQRSLTRGGSRSVGRATQIGGRDMLVRIGKATDVADGEMRVFEVAGTKVNVSNAGGHLYAFDDTCTHMGCSLANGELDGTTVTCACHGSQFDVTSGAVLRGPAQRPVRSRAVQVEGEELLTES
ncbi:MAG TPA: non-heme iron oxygenase ferredoxin subunit [Candidatus Limnocylindrales bacterium]|jgi:nitrite reductase/ring-hydroxylating ferredoxin subunit